MISIICPFHNGLAYTKKCLASLLITINNSRHKNNINIIFIDDGSTDGTDKWINKNYPEVKLLYGDGNLWWSGAVNLGVKYALKQGTQYILLINNDNLFEKDYVDKLINFVIEKKFKIVGSIIMDVVTKQVWSSGGYFNKKTGGFGMYKNIRNDTSSYYVVDWLPGMSTLIHRSVFEIIGYWNEKDFPQYYGDSDFILRAKKNGIDAYVYLGSIIWNNTKSTGIVHNGSFLELIRSLYSIKSYYNVFKSVKFLLVHRTNYLGMLKYLVNKYGKYIGGYYKHKLLNLFNKRNNSE